jgi:hypothetical protein
LDPGDVGNHKKNREKTEKGQPRSCDYSSSKARESAVPL